MSETLTKYIPATLTFDGLSGSDFLEHYNRVIDLKKNDS